MTSVITAGESGSITEIIEIGPTSLVRRRSWANFQPLADACKTAGLTDRCPMAWLPVDPTAGADDTEVPNRIRLLPLASVLAGQPPFFRYTRLRPRAGSRVLAAFEDCQPALVVSASTPHRAVAFASDLLPHWGPTHAQWERFPSLLAALCALAAGDDP